jgi:hypothetical protein
VNCLARHGEDAGRRNGLLEIWVATRGGSGG